MTLGLGYLELEKMDWVLNIHSLPPLLQFFTIVRSGISIASFLSERYHLHARVQSP